MRDQRTPAEQDDATDQAVLSLLLDDAVQRPWSVEEVARELGDSLAAGDSLARLCGVGLVHRLDGFVFATRPALWATRLA